MSKVARTEGAPKGLHAVRAAIALALAGGNRLDAEPIAAARWGGDAISEVLKTATAVGTTSTWTDGDATFAAREFVGAAVETSVLGAMTAARRVPFLSKTAAMASGATAGWAGEGSPRPISELSLSFGAVEPYKLCASTIVTKEALGLPLTEGAIRTDLLRAAALALDEALISDDAGEAGVRPAGLAHGVPPEGPWVPEFAVKGLFTTGFTGDFSTSVIVAHPRTLGRMHGEIFPDVGVRGGSLAGIPAVATRAAVEDRLTLIDAAGIVYAVDGGGIFVAEHADVQADTAPDSPKTSSTTTINLWAHNLAAPGVTLFAGWKAARPGSVAVSEVIFSDGNSPS
jgi:hypothetical protein